MDSSALTPNDVPSLDPGIRDKFHNYDAILDEIGGFGIYQKLILFLVLIPAIIPNGFYNYNIVFMSATPAEYWCRLPVDNISISDLPHLLPLEQRNGEIVHSRCMMFDLNYANLTKQEIANTVRIYNGTLSVVPCRSGWDFDHSVYESTTVTEWGLVCDKEVLSTISFASSTFGGLFGAFIWAFIADRFGRKKGYFSMIAFQLTFAIASAFSPNLLAYCMFRMCIGMCTSFVYTLGLLMSIEITGTKTRALMSVICSIGYTSSVLLLLLIAYFVRDWHHFALASSVPLLSLFFLIPFFPESPRWLLAQGRLKELEVYVRKVARVNRVQLDPKFDQNLPLILANLDRHEDEETANLVDLFRTPNLRKKTLILAFINFCNSGIFTGLNLYAPAFGGNPHWSAFLTNMVEFPPYLFAQQICDRLGRRLSLFYFMLFCSIFCLVTAGITGGTALTVLSLAAKFCITITFLVAELYEEESFPTVVRGAGHSFTSVVSQFAGVGAPFVVNLGNAFLVLPLVVFGCLSVVGAGTTLFMPETVYKQLPQTLDDGENFGKHMRWSTIVSLVPPKRPKKTRVQLVGFKANLKEEGPYTITG
ncbi:beta-alanine transporter-like [Paramacrobiotus metropolitanus]|uniref:beta-alanine transporter-like n=1 Tax=Paramacrobiotus metropolitanus TaxID=2943436 RepID=UPI002446299B|nr:beta-alanine transporter-like [Paramacrobiotus metropolitanus]XP_055328917.1 beta-alanine transporter-like [Paramacrobiotus metropolitanus]XP_055328918.1 beta-alanine transporter-like [Paramacrobiotus metropolitanus]